MSRPRTRIGRNQQKKIKKKKSRFKVFTTMLILVILAITYSVYHYKAGFHEASNKTNNMPANSSEKQPKEFQGKVDKLGKINVLLLGVDSGDAEKSRTDTIMIAQYDPKKGSAKIASIMRDTYVSIPGYKNNKINTAFFHGGPELLRQTVKENFGIDVEYYALVNFDGFVDVVNIVAPDGIEVDVEKKMRYQDPTQDLYIKLDPGIQKLDGANLLDYARYRSDAEGDFGRVRRQQQVINAVKEELLSVKGILKAPEIAGTITPYINTNFKKSDVLSIGTNVLLNSVKQIETMTIPIEGSYQFARYSHAGSVIDLNTEKNKKALQDFFNSTSTEEQTASTEQKTEKKS